MMEVVMLWSKTQSLKEEPFHTENELEEAICGAAGVLFGSSRVYLNIKKKVGAKGKIRNVPDGYLIDLASVKQPRLFVVEVELAQHDPLKHVAVQILEFSLSFETSCVFRRFRPLIPDEAGHLFRSKAAGFCRSEATLVF
jgi:hypothetical protein